ncbi:MAG: hypothetical protein WCH34_01130 [Bacteroidota bacterium]
MKKIIFKALLLPAIFAASTFFFTNCAKETDCKAVITVKFLYDTNFVVPNAYVKLDKYDIVATGTTDASGRFTTTFKSEAILDVFASIDTSTTGFPPLTGTGTIRLKPGETAEKSIFVN